MPDMETGLCCMAYRCECQSAEIIGLMGQPGRARVHCSRRWGCCRRGRRDHGTKSACRSYGYDIALSVTCRKNPDDTICGTVRDELSSRGATMVLDDAPPVAPDKLLHELELGAVRALIHAIVGRSATAIRACCYMVTATDLVLDEPTRGLDAPANKRWQFAAQVGRRHMAIVLATHDVRWRQLWLTRWALLAEGKLVAMGNSADVLTSDPAFTPQIARLFSANRMVDCGGCADGLMFRRKRHIISRMRYMPKLDKIYERW